MAVHGAKPERSIHSRAAKSMEVLAGKAGKGADEVNPHVTEQAFSDKPFFSCTFTKAHPSNQASVIDLFRAHVQPPSAMRGSGLDKKKVERNLSIVVYEFVQSRAGVPFA